jgi:hypothetical protein
MASNAGATTRVSNGQACPKCSEELDRFDLRAGLCPRCDTNFAMHQPVASSLTGMDNTGAISPLHATGEIGDLYVISLDDPAFQPRIFRELTGVKITGFAAGCGRTLVISAEGQAHAVTHAAMQLQPLAGQLLQASFGATHMAALTRSGQVFTLGEGVDGELGHGSRRPLADVALVGSLMSRTMIQVCCAAGHTLALSQAGDVYSSGRGFEGQLGLGKVEAAPSPRVVLSLREPCIQIAAGGKHSAAIAASGSAYTWGEGLCGQLGLGRCTKKAVPTRIDGLPLLAAVACGTNHTAFLDADGALHSCGMAARGQPYAASVTGGRKAFTPQRFTLPAEEGPIAEIDAAGDATVLRSERGAVFCFAAPPAVSAEGEDAQPDVVPDTLRRIDTLGALCLGSVCTSGTDLLAFAPLCIAAVTPACSPLCGGGQLTLRGSGFFSSSQVLLRFTHIPTGTYRLVQGAYAEDKARTTEGGCPERLVTCRVPSFAIEGPGQVSVALSLDGTSFTPPSTMHVAYYEEPALLELSPSAGPSGGGTPLILRTVPTTTGAPALFDSAAARGGWFRPGAAEGIPLLVAAAAYDSAALGAPRRTKPPKGAGAGEMRLLCPPASNFVLAAGGVTTFGLALDGQSYGKSRLPFRFYTQPVFDAIAAGCRWSSADGGATIKISASGSVLFGSEELRVRLTYKPPPPPAEPELRQLELHGELVNDDEAAEPAQGEEAESTVGEAAESAPEPPPPPPPIAEGYEATLVARYDENDKAVVFRMPPTRGEGALNLSIALNGVDFVEVPGEIDTYARLTVASLSPALGPSVGGSRIELRGEGLRDAEALCVLFVAGEIRRVVPATYAPHADCAVCESPAWDVASAGGDAIVEVSLNGGQEWTFSCRHFCFFESEVRCMEPGSGPVGGGTAVVLTGRGLCVAGATPRVRLVAPPAEGEEVGQTREVGATISQEHGTLAFETPAFDGAAESFDVAVHLALNGSHFVPVQVDAPDTEAEPLAGQQPPMEQVDAIFRYDASAKTGKKK